MSLTRRSFAALLAGLGAATATSARAETVEVDIKQPPRPSIPTRSPSRPATR